MHANPILWKVNTRCSNPSCATPIAAVRYRPSNYPHPQPVCCSYQCAVQMAQIRHRQQAAVHGHGAAFQAFRGNGAWLGMVQSVSSGSETPMEGVVDLANCPAPASDSVVDRFDVACRLPIAGEQNASEDGGLPRQTQTGGLPERKRG